MAANGFIELLRIAKQGNKNYVSNDNEVNRWSGIAFEMMGQYFVAPLEKYRKLSIRQNIHLFPILSRG